MHTKTILALISMAFVIGCVSPMSNSQRFQNVINSYRVSATPKALYLAYDNVDSWALGVGNQAIDVDQAKSWALQNCENTRLAYGVVAPCVLYYENNDLVYTSLIQSPGDKPDPQHNPKIAYGTCFAIDPHGVIITANHVIEGAAKISVLLPDGSRYDARVLSTSERIDIAVLSISARNLPWIPLAPSKSYRSGDYIFVLGYPVRSILGDEVKFTDGSISALTGVANEAAFMQISAPVQPGNSGGPVLTEQGEVAAVLVSSVAITPFLEHSGSLPQNINWATNIDFVRPLISVEMKSRPLSDRRQAIARAKDATCIVEAVR